MASSDSVPPATVPDGPPPPLAGGTLVAFAATTDLARADAFYAGVLALRRIETTPIATVYAGRGAALRVTLVDRVAGAPYTVLGWTVPDIAAAVAALRARGTEINRYAGVDQDAAGIWTAPSGTRVAWFSDPDGNVLSLSQPPTEGPAA